MAVEGEGHEDTRPPHDFETDTIDEAQGATTGNQMSARGRLVDLAGHPDQAQDRHDVAFEDTDGLQAQPPEDDGRSRDGGQDIPRFF